MSPTRTFAILLVLARRRVRRARRCVRSGPSTAAAGESAPARHAAVVGAPRPAADRRRGRRAAPAGRARRRGRRDQRVLRRRRGRRTVGDARCRHAARSARRPRSSSWPRRRSSVLGPDHRFVTRAVATQAPQDGSDRPAVPRRRRRPAPHDAGRTGRARGDPGAARDADDLHGEPRRRDRRDGRAADPGRDRRRRLPLRRGALPPDVGRGLPHRGPGRPARRAHRERRVHAAPTAGAGRRPRAVRGREARRAARGSRRRGRLVGAGTDRAAERRRDRQGRVAAAHRIVGVDAELERQPPPSCSPEIGLAARSRARPRPARRRSRPSSPSSACRSTNVSLVDGSGLDRQPRHVPSLVATLDLGSDPRYKILWDGLAVAGQKGTLVDQIGGDLDGQGPGQDRVARRRRGLAGIVDVEPPLRFAFLANGEFERAGRDRAAAADRADHRHVPGRAAGRRARARAGGWPSRLRPQQVTVGQPYDSPPMADEHEHELGEQRCAAAAARHRAAGTWSSRTSSRRRSSRSSSSAATSASGSSARCCSASASCSSVSAACGRCRPRPATRSPATGHGCRT